MLSLLARTGFRSTAFVKTASIVLSHVIVVVPAVAVVVVIMKVLAQDMVAAGLATFISLFSMSVLFGMSPMRRSLQVKQTMMQILT